MSYVERPRIGFLGTDAMTNPSTANNENVIHLLDYANVELLNPPVLDGAELEPMDPAAYREWMTTLITADTNPGDKHEPLWAPSMPGYWNYYGDHLTTFGSASVNSVWLDPEPEVDDPLLGARLVFNAKLVDLDPADTFSSQLISARFSVIGANADGSPAELIAGVPTIAHTRWLNFNRPHGAGTFQCVIPNDGLRFIDESRAPRSRGLAALRAGAGDGGGILLRYCLYAMVASTPITQMYDRFQQGDSGSNPKVGRVLGTLGVWNGSDMTTVPIGRILQPPFWPKAQPPQSSGPAPRVVSHADVERLHTPGTKAFAALAQTSPVATIGPAAAVVVDDRVVLDLLTTFPEAGRADPSNPMSKTDFGIVELVVVDDTEPPLPLGTIAYDQATYEAQAGVVELALPPDPGVRQRLAAGTLVARTASGEVLLREIGVHQVETDDRNIYLDMERDKDGTPVARGSVRVLAFSKGQPVTDDFTLTVQLFEDVMEPGTANSTNPLVVHQCLLTEPPGERQQITVTDGTADVPIVARAPGCFKLRFLPPGMTPEDDPNFATEFYANYRVLPFHDYSDTSDRDLTWSFMYREVFSYYAVLYPIMASIIPWGPSALPNDPERVAQFAAIMRQAVDQRYVGTALAMPITRELDAGKRTLIQRWCDLQLQPGPADCRPGGSQDGP